LGANTQGSNYERAVDALARALAFGIHPSLDGIRALTEALGRPQDAFASIQVTGTNGKTSTARLTEAILREQGARTGLYTSPHLERYPERIEVDGEVASDDEFALAILGALEAADGLRPGAQGTAEGFTEFELLTAAALWLFRERDVDIAVLEVGMGGTWDATSVVDPAVSVITGVGLDHTAVLGDTVEQIAAEKAGIIKPASAPVLGPGTRGLEAIFLARAEGAHTHARAVRADGEPSPVGESLTVRFHLTDRMHGPGGFTVANVRGIHADYSELALAAPSYQVENLASSVAAAEAALGRALAVDPLRAALRCVSLPGRFEIVSSDPLVVVDGSHNPQAASVLAGAVREAWPDPSDRPSVLLGVLEDKDVAGIVRALAPVAARFFACTPASPRALDGQDLAETIFSVTGGVPRVFASVGEAVSALVAPGAPPLVVTGSLTTAGEARGLLRIGMATRGD